MLEARPPGALITFPRQRQQRRRCTPQVTTSTYAAIPTAVIFLLWPRPRETVPMPGR